MGNTFIINRINLRKMLVMLQVSEKSIEEFEASLNKAHRHVNAITFANMLQKVGLKQEDIANILRRIGIDDITISNIFNTLDEEKISETFGRIVELNVT